MTWHAQRFNEHADRVRFDCVACKRPMWFPPSKAGKYKTCGGECNKAVLEAAASTRTRACETCARPFTPRPGQLRLGQGRYCSVACSEPARAAGRTQEVARRRGLKRRENVAAGLLVFPRGPAHPSWKGGKEEHLKRRTLSGAAAAGLRKYRRANPEKAREWAQKRRHIGRLPRGTVAKLLKLQRWRCACCAVDIRRGYHVDHVMPLARGGRHEPDNLQLLCGPCNVRKSAKDPIAFMQSRGFLL
jgi:hypothetical protein